MRPEEELAIAAVLRYLGHGATASEGDDPPDYYLVLDGDQIAAEVTLLMPMTFDEAEEPKNRTSEDMVSQHLCDRLDREFKSHLPDTLTLCFKIWGPLRNPRVFTREIQARVRAMIGAEGFRSGWREKWELAGNAVEATLIVSDSPTGKRVVGVIANDDSRLWMEGEARAILKERISAKEAIMSRQAWTGRRWLVFVNGHPNTSATIFAQAYTNLALDHGFERVLLVDRDGSVSDLRSEA